MPTVLHRLARWADSTPGAPAQRFKENGQWKTITAREYMDRVYYLALFFEAVPGLSAEDVAAILSPNCPEWAHLDLAALLVGAKAAGLYPNSNLKDIQYVLNHTQCKVLSVRNREYFEKLGPPGQPVELIDSVKCLIVIDGDQKSASALHPRAVSYREAVVEGKRRSLFPGAKRISDFLAKIDAHAGKILIYTSGTTGNPKGALLSHDNLAFTSDLVARHWHFNQGRGELLSFLPLCHIAEKMQSIGVGISQRYCTSFCTKFDNVAVELPEVQPTLLLCVPRLWEKMMEGVNAKIEGSRGLKKQLAAWALSVGEKTAANRLLGHQAPPLNWLQLPYRVADKLVLVKIRKALGLARAERVASGAAALPAHVVRWFRGVGIEILEDFGQTESTGVICMTEIGVDSAGTVGRPVPGIQVKLAEDGEILCKGRNVFKGYFKDEVATSQVLNEGWLATGDLAEIGRDGLWRIKGRKKEILKTSGGKMIAPLPIEEGLKAFPEISQVCMVGDGRKFLGALITLSETYLKSRGLFEHASDRRVTEDPAVLREVGARIEAVNQTLASYSQIKAFVVLGQEFSIAEGEMTPTLKMKRNVIEARYKDIIDRWYA